jgi:hypothetical protein
MCGSVAEDFKKCPGRELRIPESNTQLTVIYSEVNSSFKHEGHILKKYQIILQNIPTMQLRYKMLIGKAKMGF